MFAYLRHFFGWFVDAFRSREDLLLENLALRQQLLSLHARRPRPRLSPMSKLFWVVLGRIWPGWRRSLILVAPQTVVRWHRQGFKLYWAWISRTRHVAGRRPLTKELLELIARMASENSTWGAPRIHGELLMLGFDLSERSVSRWVTKCRKSPEPIKQWLTFLKNHREAIAAMDFFTLPTLTFGVLHCFFVISHDRRRILHYNVTRHPNAFWIALQLREAFQFGESSMRFLISDNDVKFSKVVVSSVVELGCCPVRTAFRCPWQNGIAERWVGSIRRDLLDHVIVLNERHMRRLLRDYVRYYHEDRTHLGLGKETPGRRSVSSASADHSVVTSQARLGGLHHRYQIAA